MAKLENVDVGSLEQALEETSDGQEAKRLIAAIIYKRGPSVPMLAEWLDVRKATIYRWFDRLEAEPIRQAVADRPRSGRPPKLTDEEQERFRHAVRGSPSSVGYDQAAWTTGLAQTFIADQFGVEYTSRHVQRLLQDAELSRVGDPAQLPGDNTEGNKQYWSTSPSD